jgi:Rad3-related DNA helicase
LVRALDNLARVGQLKAEPASRAEFDGLVRSGSARLNDAANETLSVYSRFDLAYNAAHALALAALRHRGYRSESRYLVFQCLGHTLDLPTEQWRVLDEAHRKRNVAEYTGDAEIEPALLEALLRVARELERRVLALEPP